MELIKNNSRNKRKIKEEKRMRWKKGRGGWCGRIEEEEMGERGGKVDEEEKRNKGGGS